MRRVCAHLAAHVVPQDSARRIDATLRLHQHDAAATHEIAELQLGALPGSISFGF
jgi:hypothetical protein